MDLLLHVPTQPFPMFLQQTTLLLQQVPGQVAPGCVRCLREYTAAGREPVGASLLPPWQARYLSAAPGQVGVPGAMAHSARYTDWYGAQTPRCCPRPRQSPSVPMLLRLLVALLWQLA